MVIFLFSYVDSRTRTPLNAARMSAAGESWIEPNLYFLPVQKMQIESCLRNHKNHWFICVLVKHMVSVVFLILCSSVFVDILDVVCDWGRIWTIILHCKGIEVWASFVIAVCILKQAWSFVPTVAHTNLNVIIQDKVFGLSSKNILQKIKIVLDKIGNIW